MNDIIWRHSYAQASKQFFRGIFMVIVRIWKKNKSSQTNYWPLWADVNTLPLIVKKNDLLNYYGHLVVFTTFISDAFNLHLGYRLWHRPA